MCAVTVLPRYVRQLERKCRFSNRNKRYPNHTQLTEFRDYNKLEVPYRTFHSVIRYIYTGDVAPSNVSVEDDLLLFSAANHYMLPKLKVQCEKILMKELARDNVCSIHSGPFVPLSRISIDE